MTENAILKGLGGVVTTSTTIVMGYAPGQTYPPELIVVNAGAATLALPPITTSFSNGLWTQGIGDGATIRIKTLTTAGITVSAASGDTLSDTITLTVAKSEASLMSSLVDRTWYRIATV